MPRKPTVRAANEQGEERVEDQVTDVVTEDDPPETTDDSPDGDDELPPDPGPVDPEPAPVAPSGTYARGGEGSDELQRLPNTPLIDPDAPATSFDPNVRVNQQVDLQTANRMALKTAREMNRGVDEAIDGTTARMLRRRGRSLV